MRSLVADNGIIYAAYRGMSSCKLLVALAIATAFSFVQPVKADQKGPAGRAYFEWPHHQDSRQPSGVVPVSVPDAGSTLPLLGFASLGLVALRRKLRC